MIEIVFKLQSDLGNGRWMLDLTYPSPTRRCGDSEQLTPHSLPSPTLFRRCRSSRLGELDRDLSRMRGLRRWLSIVSKHDEHYIRQGAHAMLYTACNIPLDILHLVTT